MPICDGYVHNFCYCSQLLQRSLPHASDPFAQGRTLSGASLVLFTGAHQLRVSGPRYLPTDKYNGHQRNLSQKSGSIHFELTVENHVALDIHAVVQKWNGYRFVSRP